MAGRHQRPQSQLPWVLGLLVLAAVVVLLVNDLWSAPPIRTTTTSPIAVATTATSLSTTTSPLIATTTVATTLADPLAALALAGDGIGDFNFGSEPEAMITQVTAVLGSPDEDSGWTDTFDTCPGTQARIIRWSSLQLFFTDGETSWGSGPHFFHYGQSLAAGGGVYLDLRTDKGIGVGSSIGELRAAYGEAVAVGDDPAFGPYWEVIGEAPAYLWGTATGIDDGAVLDALSGGNGCGE